MLKVLLNAACLMSRDLSYHRVENTKFATHVISFTVQQTHFLHRTKHPAYFAYRQAQKNVYLFLCLSD